MKPVILDFDGTVMRQKLDDYFPLEQISLYHLRDELQFWGKKPAIDSLRSYVESFWQDAVCWLTGSGDFHHLTLLFLEALQEPYLLIVFDNHTDCSLFPPKYHCGNWVYHAAKSPLCRRVIHIGATQGLNWRDRYGGLHQLEKSDKLVIIPGRKRHATALLQECEQQFQIYQQWGMPIYVSIDKDVLCAKQAATDWENGHMEIDLLTHLIKILAVKFRIIGADITGEKGGNMLYNKSLLKSLWSMMEHPAGRRESGIRSDLQHKMLNIEILKALGVRYVAL